MSNCDPNPNHGSDTDFPFVLVAPPELRADVHPIGPPDPNRARTTLLRSSSFPLLRPRFSEFSIPQYEETLPERKIPEEASTDSSNAAEIDRAMAACSAFAHGMNTYQTPVGKSPAISQPGEQNPPRGFISRPRSYPPFLKPRRCNNKKIALNSFPLEKKTSRHIDVGKVNVLKDLESPAVSYQQNPDLKQVSVFASCQQGTCDIVEPRSDAMKKHEDKMKKAEQYKEVKKSVKESSLDDPMTPRSSANIGSSIEDSCFDVRCNGKAPAAQGTRQSDHKEAQYFPPRHLLLPFVDEDDDQRDDDALLFVK